MRIISLKTIKNYVEQHPESKTAFQRWAKKVEKAQWKNFADVKKIFQQPIMSETNIMFSTSKAMISG